MFAMLSEMGRLTICSHDLINLVLGLLLREHVPVVELLQAIVQLSLAPERYAQHDGADDRHIVWNSVSRNTRFLLEKGLDGIGRTIPPDGAVFPRLLELSVDLLASCLDQALRVGDESGDNAVLGVLVGDDFVDPLLDGLEIACVLPGENFELFIEEDISCQKSTW